ncbi:MAG: Rrf2 family transcriptional regulator, partial [Arenibacter algicola]|nr:Rrf2 family transcriptional regulator [Arenibacter algicola]
MHLTRFTDNALRVLIYLSAEPERKANITEIAEACAVPRNHLT